MDVPRRIARERVPATRLELLTSSLHWTHEAMGFWTFACAYFVGDILLFALCFGPAKRWSASLTAHRRGNAATPLLHPRVLPECWLEVVILDVLCGELKRLTSNDLSG